MSNLQKETEASFVRTMTRLHRYVNPKTNEPAPLLSGAFFFFLRQIVFAPEKGGKVTHRNTNKPPHRR